ncbi:MAG TPA: carbohydrate kinase family protein, partial [bacterium]|nr:carbohydrate kinase family protein [bacterium]
MTKKFDLVTIGGATQDIAVNLEDYKLIDNHQDLLAQRLLAIEYGTKTIAKKSFVEYGGGAANVAIAAATCGIKVSCLTAIGPDRRGQDILDNLKKHKIATDNVKSFDKQQSALSLVMIGQDGEHTIITFRGANDSLKLNQADIKQLQTDWLYISSLSGPYCLTNLKNIASSKKNIIWNPGQQQLSLGLTK